MITFVVGSVAFGCKSNTFFLHTFLHCKTKGKKTAWKCPIERFPMTSRPPYWCSKTKAKRPYWCTKPFLGIKLYFHGKIVFCFSNIIGPLVPWMKRCISDLAIWSACVAWLNGLTSLLASARKQVDASVQLASACVSVWPAFSFPCLVSTEIQLWKWKIYQTLQWQWPNETI